MTIEELEIEKGQLINAINAAIDALTEFEWYCDANHPCSNMPEDIRHRLRIVLKENKLLTHNASAQENPVKVFIWNDKIPPYTYGIVFAVAETLEDARRQVVERCGYDIGAIVANEPSSIEDFEAPYAYLHMVLR